MATMKEEQPRKKGIDDGDEMRLRDPTKNFSGDSSGANAEIVDQILGTSERKRARPTSSLDVRVDHGDKLARPPTVKKLQRNAQGSYNRAQGGRVSKQKYQLSDLEGMSEDQLLQALYDDPELASAAAAAAEKIQKTKKPHTPRSSRTRYNRSIPDRQRGSTKYPAHLKAMMDDGIPIKQWIILLVLIGAGVYQLRKALVGPTIPSAKKGRRPPRQLFKKGKKTKSFKPQAADPIEDIPDITEEDVVKPKAARKVNNKKKKLRTKQASKAKKTTNEPKPREVNSHDSPDSISTDGSSSTDGARETDRLDLAPVTTSFEVDEPMPNEPSAPLSSTANDGWKTVGSKQPPAPEVPVKVQNRPLDEASKKTVVSDARPAIETVPSDSVSQGTGQSDAAPGLNPPAIEEKETEAAPGLSPRAIEEKETETVEEKETETEDAKDQDAESNHSLPLEASSSKDEEPENGASVPSPVSCKPPAVGDASEDDIPSNDNDNVTQEVAKGGTDERSSESVDHSTVGGEESANDTPADSNQIQEPADRGDLASNEESMESQDSPSVAGQNKEEKTDDAAGISEVVPPDTTHDEALAKKLQLEEERWAKSSALAESASAEEVWAEVPTKRKKRAS